MTPGLLRIGTSLPNIGTAALPATYERAKIALAACNQIDECKDWADKAAALASYAKQADDNSLQKLALRIQARAIRRCGELLQTFQSPGARTDKQPPDGIDGRFTQRQAAESAGMSERQELTAVRVANVPASDFELAIESDDPPTVTRLAELGTKSQPKVAEKFAEATHVLGVLYTFATFCGEHEPAAIAHALYPHECKSARGHVATVEAWLAAFMKAIKED
jgi:hypothetical protein